MFSRAALGSRSAAAAAEDTPGRYAPPWPAEGRTAPGRRAARSAGSRAGAAALHPARPHTAAETAAPSACAARSSSRPACTSATGTRAAGETPPEPSPPSVRGQRSGLTGAQSHKLKAAEKQPCNQTRS